MKIDTYNTYEPEKIENKSKIFEKNPACVLLLRLDCEINIEMEAAYHAQTQKTHHSVYWR
jgi:hypothetical protein